MMPRLRFYYTLGTVLALVCGSCTTSRAVAQEAQQAGDAKPQAAARAAEGKVGKLPHVEFDVKQRQVRVECESLGVETPLEFFCVKTGGSEHESVLRTPAKPSDIHTALLAIGLQPGRPVQYSEALNKWLPPQGPPLHISIQWEKDGRTVSVPAYRCMRNLRTKEEMKPVNWVFCGSRVMEDGEFAADVTGYVVSVVNFDLTLIDLPEVASNSNELLEWERNPDVAPPAKTKVTMLIQPAGRQEMKVGAPRQAPKEKAEGGAPAGNEGITDVTVDQRRMDALRERWMAAVRPHSAALRDAAQAHYEVITAMRAEQQRLIDEADRLQRSIDALEKEYQDLTTPRPSPAQ
jgi:hypothetical protein